MNLLRTLIAMLVTIYFSGTAVAADANPPIETNSVSVDFSNFIIGPPETPEYSGSIIVDQYHKIHLSCSAANDLGTVKAPCEISKGALSVANYTWAPYRSYTAYLTFDPPATSIAGITSGSIGPKVMSTYNKVRLQTNREILLQLDNPPANFSYPFISATPSGANVLRITGSFPQTVGGQRGDPEAYYFLGLNSLSWTTASKLKPTLSLADVQITQAVSNFAVSDLQTPTPLPIEAAPGSSSNSFVLVQGKSAIIITTLKVANAKSGDNTPVTVKATFPDGTSYSSTPIAMSSIGVNGSEIVIGPVPINLPVGKHILKVVPEALNATALPPVDGQSNGLASVKVNQTRALSINYFPMSYTSSGSIIPVISETVPSITFGEHINESNLLLEGMMPIADNAIDQHVGLPLNSAAPRAFLSGLSAINSDLGQLAYQGTIINPGGQASIGIVSTDYFLNRGVPEAFGVANFDASNACNNKVTRGVLVTAGRYPTTAHEVGHTFGLVHDVGTTEGFWVNAFLKIQNLPGLMSDTLSNIAPYPQQWPTKQDYACFYAQLSKTNVDPQTILVSGSIDKNGKVTLMPVVYLRNGVTTSPNVADDGKIQVLDSQGTIVSESSFRSNYTIIGDNGSTYPVDSSYFIAQVPYSQDATSIKILQSSKTILTIDPNEELLLSAVKNIGLESFKKNPSLGRTLLLTQVKIINSLMRGCTRIKKQPWITRCDGIAVTALLNLKRSVNSLLNESVSQVNPGQSTKSYVVSLIDLIALGAIPNLSVQSRRDPISIRILPHGSQNDDVGFSIQSVTQGLNGSVYLNTNGTVQYSPYSNGRKNDQFTVTIKDAEGDSVTKTISIIAPELKSKDDKGEVGNLFRCQ